MRVDIGSARVFLEVFGQEWVPSGDELAKRPTVIALHGGPGGDGTKLRHYVAPLADSPGRRPRPAWARTERPGHARDLEPRPLGRRRGRPLRRARDRGPHRPRRLVRRVRRATLRERLPGAQSGAEWERVCGPLLCLNPRGDPDHERLEALRIRTPDVNLHFYRGEARAMDLRPDLARVRCPTLVLVGEHDPLVPVELAQEIVDAIPGDLARLVPVPDASHEVLVDNPAVAFGAVREFLLQRGSSRSR